MELPREAVQVPMDMFLCAWTLEFSGKVCESISLGTCSYRGGGISGPISKVLSDVFRLDNIVSFILIQDRLIETPS